MAWNNGYERKRFEEEQKRLAEEYRAAGMTEEQIRNMYEFDLEIHNSDRRYAEHSQRFPDSIDEDDNEGKSPLLAKFREAVSVEMDYFHDTSGDSWIDELDNPELTKAVRALSDKDREILRLLAFEGWTQVEIADYYGMKPQSVAWHIKKFKKILKKFF